MALQKALDDKCKIQLENEAIKSEIKSLKNQVSRSRVQTVDVDDVIQDSLQLKAKLVQASCDTKVSLNEAHQSKKAVKPQKCLTLDQIERPLKFLNKHQHLSHQCQEYLRKMNVALLETLDIKEKLMSSIVFVNLHNESENLGTDFYDVKLNKVKTVPYKHNYGYFFTSGPNTWHGMEKKEIKKERRCIQINYVTFETDWKVKS